MLPQPLGVCPYGDILNTGRHLSSVLQCAQTSAQRGTRSSLQWPAGLGSGGKWMFLCISMERKYWCGEGERRGREAESFLTRKLGLQ